VSLFSFFMLDLTINDYPISYILWNTILGAIPFFLCYTMFSFQKLKNKVKKVYQLFFFIIWLVFLPNAPYILTDIRHINGFCANTVDDICAVNAWMIAFFFIYGLFAWILYYYTLAQMIVFIKTHFSCRFSKYFPIIISPIISLGLLLGLIDRLNTWDIIFRPGFVIKSSLAYFSFIDNIINLFVFTVCLLIMYYLGRLLFQPIEENKIFKNTII